MTVDKNFIPSDIQRARFNPIQFIEWIKLEEHIYVRLFSLTGNKYRNLIILFYTKIHGTIEFQYGGNMLLTVQTKILN